MLEDLELFCGAVSPNLAHVYARLEGLEDPGRYALRGRLRGPFSEFARTLTTEVPLTDMGPGPSLLARALLPDPSLWSHKLPSWYEVELQLCEGARVLESCRRELGVRLFGTRCDDFLLEGKRWVLRGVQRSAVADEPLAQWRALSAAMLVDEADDDVCRAASHDGVWLAVRVPVRHPASLASELRRLAGWAAVAVIVVDGVVPPDVPLQRLVANAQLGQWFSVEDEVRPAEWADVALVECDTAAAFAGRVAGCELPVVAVAKLAAERERTLAEGRSACDQLQALLAPFGDYAGYVVTG